MDNGVEVLEYTQITHWEDFELGRTWTSAPRRITQEDLEAFTRLSGDDHPIHVSRQAVDPSIGLFDRPVLQGTFGVALFTGFVRRMGLDNPALALLDTKWRYLNPIYVGDDISCEVTITRKRLSSTQGRGLVHRHVLLRNQAGEVVQEGTSALLAASRGDTDVPAALQFGSPVWGQALVPFLEADAGFIAAVSSYDGTIGLRVGQEEVHFRIYRGSVIEAARRSLLGADFVLGAEEHIWTELILGDANDFMKRAMLGQFTAKGNGAEYLRMTKALVHIVDAARAAAQKESGA
jgi:acyl dehydratase/putative sterol carrier protein